MSYGLKGSSIWSIRSGCFRALNVLTKKSEQSLKLASVSCPWCPGRCFQQFRWQRFRRQLWRLRWTIGLHLPCRGWLHFPPMTSTTPSSLLSKKRLGPARRAGMAPVDFGGVGVEPSQGGLTILHSPAYKRKWMALRTLTHEIVGYWLDRLPRRPRIDCQLDAETWGATAQEWTTTSTGPVPG